MRICHVTNDLDRGGVQSYLASLLPALQANGHQVALALVSGTGELTATLDHHAIPWTYVKAIGRAGALRWPDPRSLSDLGRWFRRFRPDVVQTHLFLGNTIGRIAARATGIPVILGTEHSTYFGKKWPSRWIDRELALKTSGVVAVSHAVARHVCATEGIPQSRITVIPHGIHLPDLAPLPPQAAPLVIGTVGRLHPDKRLDLFLDALAQLKKRGVSVHGVVLGDGPLRSWLEKRADTVGLGGKGVEFKGWCRNVATEVATWHCAVFPSRREGFGLAALEAMAVGVPVVLSDIPAFQEITAGGTYGQVVPLERASLDEWATAIDMAATTDRPSRRAFVRGWVAEHYSFERHVGRLESFYAALLKDR